MTFGASFLHLTHVLNSATLFGILFPKQSIVSRFYGPERPAYLSPWT